MQKGIRALIGGLMLLASNAMAQDPCKALADDMVTQEKSLAANYAESIATRGESAVLVQLRVNAILITIQTLVVQLAHYNCEVPTRAITAGPYLEPAVECSIALMKQKQEVAARRLSGKQANEPEACDRKTWVTK